MSNVLPVALAIIIGGVALTPVIYSMKNPTTPTSKSSQAVQLGKDSSNLQKISYALGYSLAQHVPPEADTDALVVGFRDARDSKEAIYTDQEMQTAFDEYKKEVEGKQAEIAQAKSTPEEKEFFAENGKKAGVKTTPSGLQYKVIKEGTGASPSPTAKVTVHYEGKLLNGSIFDSSLKRGEPITFPLNGVIPGWTEGLGLMKEGGKTELYIPAGLAYGDREMPGIPANSPLIFEVELIKVEE